MSKTETHISAETLRELLQYEAASGRLIWLAREAKHSFGAEQSAEHTAKIWNAKYAGKPALVALNQNGYQHGTIFGKFYSAHRVAWALHFGEWPENGIDHINGDRTDNRISNLRDVPDRVNAKNQKQNCRNTSGVTGVHLHKKTGRWVASIKGEGKVRNLGYYRTIEEAAAVRSEAEKKYGFHPNHGRKAA